VLVDLALERLVDGGVQPASNPKKTAKETIRLFITFLLFISFLLT
jgi:hypothetical protein